MSKSLVDTLNLLLTDWLYGQQSLAHILHFSDIWINWWPLLIKTSLSLDHEAMFLRAGHIRVTVVTISRICYCFKQYCLSYVCTFLMFPVYLSFTCSMYNFYIIYVWVYTLCYFIFEFTEFPSYLFCFDIIIIFFQWCRSLQRAK